MNPGCLIVPLLLVLLPVSRLPAEGQTGRFGDQGDGTYRNPIIAADYSDPDVIRVGPDFYLVTSTFQLSPGVTVLHSRDLVNWESIGAVFSDVSKLGPRFNWDKMGRYNEGVYAPSIRHHAGKFWVFVNCHSGEGFFMATATNPAGPWTTTQILDRHGKPLRTNGWTDPCPFWDDDGKAYLASSRPGGQWFGYLFEMSPDGTRLLDADVDKMNTGQGPYAYPEGGTLFSPFQSTEGNKIYKRNGYYYLQHIEFLDKGQGHGTYFFRSKNLYGTRTDGTPGKPGDAGKYDVLKLGDDLPGQGALVDTPDGRWFWIAQFNRMNSDGRAPHLMPVTWEGDWPVVGVEAKDRRGKFTWQGKIPVSGGPVKLPQGSDEFDAPTLGPPWQWNHQPRADRWSLTERPGFLRLRAFKPLETGKFFKVGNVLLQRHLRSEATVATVKLDVGHMADGQETGLAHFNGGKNKASVGVTQRDGTQTLQFDADGNVTPGATLSQGTTDVWLRSTVGFDDMLAFAYSLDGKDFVPLGPAYKVKQGGYRGDMVGVYTFNPEAEAGYVDLDFFRYDVKNR